MLGVVGYVGMLSASVIYSAMLKSSEVSTMMVLACLINFSGAIVTLLYVQNIMLGINPYVYICMTSTVSEVLYNAFVNLPSSVLFAKMIPSNIEASMFAITTGIMDCVNLFAAK